MNALLEEPSKDQRAVLSAIHGDFETNARWPYWQYTDLQIKPQGAATSALLSMPRLRDTSHTSGQGYGWTWWSRRPQVPTPGTEVSLTVAGLMALKYDELPKLYVRLLQHCIQEQTKLKASPREVVAVTLEFKVLLKALMDEPSTDADENERSRRRLLQLGLLARQEPPTAGHVVGIDDGTWRLEVPATIVDYADIVTVEDYLNRLAIEPQPIPFAHSAPSPFSIPDAVSFLDAVWTADLKARLFVNVDPSRAASLIYEARTPDEFDSRCSALADVLYRIDVPRDDGLQRRNVRSIDLLGQWIAKRLPDDPAGRVTDATSTLSRIIDIRVGAQHSTNRQKQITAFREFGLDYASNDWVSMWETLRQLAVNALDAIRQEVTNLTS